MQLRTYSPFLGALFFCSLSCQVLGGIDDLSVQNPGTGGAGGTPSTTSSSSSSSVSTGTSSSGGGDGINALWSVSFGDTTTQKVTDMAISSAGTIFVVGTFLGNMDCGPAGTLTAVNDYDAFIIALDTNGTPLWARSFGGTGPDKANTVIAGGPSGLFLAGEHAGTLDTDAGTFPSAGGLDAFILKLNPDTGAALWGTSLGDVADQRISALARNFTSGNVYAAGDFVGTMNIGGLNLTASGGSDVFVAEFSASGTPSIAQAYGDSAIQSASAIVIGEQGEAYLAGIFDGKLSIGAGSQTSAGGYDGFLAKIGPAAISPYLTRFGDSKYQKPNAIDKASTGSVLLTGTFESSFDAFGKFIQSSGARDILVASVNPSGKANWVRTFGDADPMAAPSDQEAFDIVVSNTGNTYITGYVIGTADLGNGPVTGAADTDFFLLALDPTGTPIWSTRRGGIDSQIGRTIAVDAAGNVVVAGDFRGELPLGTTPLVSAGSNDIFIAKFPASP